MTDPNQHPANYPYDAQLEMRNTVDALVIAGEHATLLGDAQVQVNAELGTKVTRFDLVDGTQVDSIQTPDQTVRLRITPQLPLADSLSEPVTLKERPDRSIEMDGSPDDEFQIVLGALSKLADGTLALQQERITKGGSLIGVVPKTTMWAKPSGTTSQQSNRAITPRLDTVETREKHSTRRVIINK